MTERNHQFECGCVFTVFDGAPWKTLIACKLHARAKELLAALRDAASTFKSIAEATGSSELRSTALRAVRRIEARLSAFAGMYEDADDF